MGDGVARLPISQPPVAPDTPQSSQIFLGWAARIAGKSGLQFALGAAVLAAADMLLSDPAMSSSLTRWQDRVRLRRRYPAVSARPL